MSDGSKIEWTDATWNPITGCSVVSPGCTNCYAMRLAGTRLKHHPSRAGLTRDTKAGPVWTGEVRFNQEWLDQPLRWRRPRLIFVCAHGDLFHESVPASWIDQVFAVMAHCPQHRFQVLTKRAERMRKYMNDRFDTEYGSDIICEAADEIGIRNPIEWDQDLPNIWLGVSVEDQTRANERIPLLLETPASVRWLSCEPLLGPVDLTCIEFPNERGVVECWDALDLHGAPAKLDCAATIDWVVAGGESGPGARPMHADWARSLRDQCAEASVPFHFKQWGEFSPTSDCNGPYMMHVGKKAAGRRLDGVEHNGVPA